jgi:hypothetical protein
MKTKSLLILVVLALLVAAGAYFSARKTDTGVPSRIGQKPFADCDFNAVTRITVIGSDATTTVVRAESGWILPELHNYWADFDKIREFIRTLAELKIGDVLRLDDAQKGELLLNAPGAPTGIGTQILLSGPGDRTIARLIVGKRPRSPNASDEAAMFTESVGARYVALEDGALVLVDNPLTDLPASSKEWMDPQFLAPAAADLIRLSVSVSNRPPLVLSRTTPTAEWTLAEGLPEGKTLDPEKVNRITSALSFLRFTAIADPALTAEKTGLNQPARIDAETADGRRYSVLFGQSEAVSATRYIRVEMAYNPPAPKAPAVAATNAPASPLPPAGDTEADRTRKTEEVQEFNQRLGTWTYTLDDFSASLLLPTPDDLIQKPLPPPSASDAAPNPAELQGDAP